MREVRWPYLFPDELERAFARRPVVFAPLGLCEPHGPGNALGLDALKAEGVCVHIARRFGGIVAPTVYWHEHEIGPYAAWADKTIGPTRPWLTALPPWMFLKNLAYQLRAFDTLGFKVTVLLTGHAGPSGASMRHLIEKLQPHLATRVLTQLEVADVLEQVKAMGWEFSHGGAMETSTLWASHPDCVDPSRFPDMTGIPCAGTHRPLAVGGDIAAADRRKGQELLDAIAQTLEPKVVAAMSQFDRLKADSPPRRPLSFADIEHIWGQEIAPGLGALPACQGLKQPLDDASMWRANSVKPRLDEIHL